MTSQPLQPIFRKDYQPPLFGITDVDLRFVLDEEQTTVHARLSIVRQAHADPSSSLNLHGEALQLKRVAVDGRDLGADEYSCNEEHLRISSVPDEFLLETEVEIKPQTNTTMMGLYKSSGNFCTQCEAEGFRRITYFLDRPDVMARYRVTLEADAEHYPILLSNGNRIDAGELPSGRHWVQWEDPFPKPSYLFALVAGKLACHRGSFVTGSGREVALEIWVEPHNIDACEHALQSLQRAMKWDEEVFGLEYDLDLYMIVAVGDFNMGAMENKGLNIFNTKYVLAKPDTATDSDYEAIEAVIAHEYFHNWTGNRVTCRDWFQLTLKEGLTVFRDQQFTADMTSAAVKRIDDVRLLRSTQFAEDAGPMAHPIRPESYVEMNNFYTTTVYNKGAEIIRMYHTLLSPEGFRRGMDLYFERHDGQAVTCDDFRAAMADANDVDLGRFERWYGQAGTPVVRAAGHYDEATHTYQLTLEQSCRKVPDLPAPQPFPIPIRMGLIGQDGQSMKLIREGHESVGDECLLELNEARQVFEFKEVGSQPVPSLLRGFSAPVILEMDRSNEELSLLMASDTDSFNRWDAGQELGMRVLLELTQAAESSEQLTLDRGFLSAFRSVLLDNDMDGSLKSLALVLPTEHWIGQQMKMVAVEAIHEARQFLRRKIAGELRDEMMEQYRMLQSGKPYRKDKMSIDNRRLKNTLLAYLTSLQSSETTALAVRQFAEADNMTDSQAALACLNELPGSERDQALADFYERWREDALVLDKWFTIQALSSQEDTFERIRRLAQHSDFTLENPNRARSLLGAFANQNQRRFHGADGRPYEFIAGKVLELDAINPQIAARLVTCFNQWRRFDARRQDMMQAQMERIASHDRLSKDVAEIVGRSLRMAEQETT